MPDTITPSSNTRKNPWRKSQNQFEIADRRTRVVKQMIDQERAELDAKTARLRKLRLEKEEADDEKSEATDTAAKRAQRSRSTISR